MTADPNTPTGKASLFAGGDRHAVQQIALQVPANRLHLVSVDKQGVARLKLRPRFDRHSERGIPESTPRLSSTRRLRLRDSIERRRRTTSWRERLLCRAHRSAFTPKRRQSDHAVPVMNGYRPLVDHVRAPRTRKGACCGTTLANATGGRRSRLMHRAHRSGSIAEDEHRSCCTPDYVLGGRSLADAAPSPSPLHANEKVALVVVSNRACPKV